MRALTLPEFSSRRHERDLGDVLQAVGALAVYAVDSVLMKRPRAWNYRRLSLSDLNLDGSSMIVQREDCELCRRDMKELPLLVGPEN